LASQRKEGQLALTIRRMPNIESIEWCVLYSIDYQLNITMVLTVNIDLNFMAECAVGAKYW